MQSRGKRAIEATKSTRIHQQINSKQSNEEELQENTINSNKNDDDDDSEQKTKRGTKSSQIEPKTNN